MKRLLFLGLALCLWCPAMGCRKRAPAPLPAPPAAPSESAASTGPVAPVDVQKLPDAPKTMEVDLSAITTALRAYVADRQIDPKLVTDLNVLVPKYIPRLPPPPAGKKYVWSNILVVSLANK